VRKVIFLLVLTILPFASGQSKSSALAPVSAPAPIAELNVVDAIILGVVEGVTEFLPISSTGHLIIATRLLHLESAKPLTSREGQPLWHKKPSPQLPAGVPLTLKLAADTYTVVIQFGAIAAVALLYWTPLMSMLLGLLGRDPAGLRLLFNILIAFIPTVVLGLLAHNWINEHLFSVGAVIIAQIAGAFLMLYAEFWRRRRAVLTPARSDFADLTPRGAAGIGALQCVAMWPGTSRSMTTIVGGYFAGLGPRRAAEFSFLLGLITLTGAAGLKSYKSGGAMIQVFGWSNVLLGGVVAAVTAAICVRFLVHWLTRHGLVLFAWYRIALAVVLAAAFYL